MKLNILYQFNDNYAPHAGASIVSLFEQNKSIEEIDVYILGEGLEAVNIERLKQTGKDYDRNIIFIDTDDLIKKVQKIGMPSYRGSYAANLRLFIPEVLKENVDRLLYLDADTIVNASLQELYMTDMGQNVIGMVLDSLTYRHKQDIGLSLEDDYYNSGVILFNMTLWRQENYTNKIIDHVLNVRNNYPSPDQDLLNVVCKDHIFRLPMEYNMQPVHEVFSDKSYQRWFGQKAYYTDEQIKKAKQNPVIFHFFRFVGEFPWHKNTVHPNKDLYNYYSGLSRWKDYEKQPADVGLVLKIEKLLYKFLPKGLFLILFKFSHYLFTEKANKDSLNNKINKNI